MLSGLSNDLTDFPAFYEKRRKALKERIRKLLGVQAGEKADSESDAIDGSEYANGF